MSFRIFSDSERWTSRQQRSKVKGLALESMLDQAMEDTKNRGKDIRAFSISFWWDKNQIQFFVKSIECNRVFDRWRYLFSKSQSPEDIKIYCNYDERLDNETGQAR